MYLGRAEQVMSKGETWWHLPCCHIRYFGNMLERSFSVRIFSAVSWLVLSSTTSSKWLAYFSSFSTMLSRIFAWLQQEKQQEEEVQFGWLINFFATSLTPSPLSMRHIAFQTIMGLLHGTLARRWVCGHCELSPDLSGQVSFSRLLIDPNGGRWSGFSLQQALNRKLMFSSHSWSFNSGRNGSPWKGVRNCMMISGG